MSSIAPSMSTSDSHAGHMTIVTPVVEFDVGYKMTLETVGPIACDATAKPQTVNNWDWFQGAILAVTFATKDHQKVLGTACLLAPGLALTAGHIFDDEILASIDCGNGSIQALGIGQASEGGFWRITHITTCPEGDVAYLSLARASAMSSDGKLRRFRLTTRSPAIGETLTLFGFRIPQVDQSDAGNRIDFVGQMYVSGGPVSEVLLHGRDRVMMPFPAIRVDCAAVGGMSGGPVMDQHGALVGITSTSWDTPDGSGPTYIAWLVGGLNMRLTIEWPKGAYKPDTHLLEIPDPLIQLEGREHYEVVSATQYGYRPWS